MSKKCVTRGYWDPEESTREKWTNDSAHGGYADILEERGLTKDFTGLSELLLGQAQPAQFQSADQTGYWWGSKVSDDGNWTELETISSNNGHTELPRSYSKDSFYGVLYNYHAASAESQTIPSSSLISADSICPYGWQLPGLDSDKENFSWASMLGAESVSIGQNLNGVEKAVKPPIALSFAGIYDYRGSSTDRSSFQYESSRPYGSSNYFVYSSNNDLGATATPKSFGRSVRCVIRN